MSNIDEDDKPTVVLDLNALRKQKIKAEEDLANIASELEFNIAEEQEAPVQKPKPRPPEAGGFTVILFDFQNDLFRKSLQFFPKGFDYKLVTSLEDLNQALKENRFQIVVFNYNVHPKAINQLLIQIKAKKPMTKTLVVGKSFDPEKIKAHAKTSAGAAGYYQQPLKAELLEKEFRGIYEQVKKVS